MCGIAGYVGSDASAFERRVEAALQHLAHRGPDDGGTQLARARDREAVLGSRRLAIVDLSPAGHMPMRREGGGQTIAFNGELYNTAALRKDLEACGVTFGSTTDTEVLLQGLTLHGPAFLDLVDGMYAFAFWDPRDGGSLLLARDRFGEKPLFVYELGDGAVVFASEMRALRDLIDGPLDVDPEALAHIVTWGYPSADRAVFRGVGKLAPGHWIRYGANARRGSLSPLASTPEIAAARGRAAAHDLLWDALRRSVTDRMIADVPVGVFLSGGIDSAAVAALAAAALPAGERLNTYTVGYPGSAFSELEPARAVARRLGTNHHEIALSTGHIEALPFIAASLGEPIGDPAALPTYFLSAAARQSSTVLLTGEGADEVLFGYPRYQMHDLADRLAAGDVLAALLARLPVRPFTRLRDGRGSAEQRDRAWKGFQPERFGLASTDAVPDASPPPGISGEPPWNNGARRSRADDVRRWMPESVLARLDRMTMAASIEARAPFLANDVVRFGLHLADSDLRRFPYGKLPLRSALVREYGRGKAFGRKRGFLVPLLDWLGGPLRELTADVFLRGSLGARGWFPDAALRTIGEAVLARRDGVAWVAWTLLIVELWARAHVDGQWPEAPLPAAAPRAEARGLRVG